MRKLSYYQVGSSFPVLLAMHVKQVMESRGDDNEQKNKKVTVFEYPRKADRTIDIAIPGNEENKVLETK